MNADLSITKITSRELESLSPEDLVDLLRCLLHCEARALGIWSPDLDVPTEIRVPDGGMDGYWNNPLPERHAFIPRKKTFYQCKAEKMTNAMIVAELFEKSDRKSASKKVSKLPKTLKPRVKEVLESGGCYAFFTTDHGVKRSSDTSQVGVATTALKSAGFILPKEAKIIFINGSKLADWTNKFVSAVALVRQRTQGLGGVHFFTVMEWSKQHLMSSPYHTNAILERLKQSIRDTLLASSSPVLRIACLSGLGKTRLVLEALRAVSHDDLHGAYLSENTVYLSYQDHGPSAVNLILHLASSGYKGIVVLDDCPADVHCSLFNKISGKGLALLTIYHEPEEANSDWKTISFNPDDIKDVVVEMLKADPRSNALGDEAIKRIADFSQGFPQIAQLILAHQKVPPLSTLKQPGGIASKLLGSDGASDNDLEHVLSALSLFRRIGGSSSKLSEDLKFIRETFAAHLSESTFGQKLVKLKEKRILQEIAHTLIVTPRPLATAFAIRLIHGEDPNKWRERIEHFSRMDLAEAFAQRIEEIEFSNQATEIGKLLLESGVPFANAEYLISGQAGARIFRALTVLNPPKALEVLEKTFAKVDQAFLKQPQGNRRDILHSLEIMVWHSNLFLRSARLILRLAAAENERWANNATGIFKGLFHLGLSGTQQPAIDRLPVLTEALDSDDPETRRMAVDALAEGLDDGTYSRISDTTLGGQRDAQKDWYPKDVREHLDYWKACFQMLKEVVEIDGTESQRAKSELAHRLHSLISTPLILELESEFQSLCEHFGGFWPDAKDSLRNFEDSPKSSLRPEHSAAINRWIAFLQPPPDDIRRRILDTVCRPGWHHQEGEDGHFIDLSQKEAESFADECVQKRVDLTPYLDALLSGDQQQSYAFGERIAEGHSDASSLLACALDLWPRIEPNARNAQFLRGFSKGLTSRRYQREQLLRKIAATPTLSELLVPLTTATYLTNADFVRVVDAIRTGAIADEQFGVLAYGSVTKNLSPSFFLREALRLLSAAPDVAPYLIDVASMYCHSESAKFRNLEALFKELATHPNIDPDEPNKRLGREWCQATEALVQTSTDLQWLGRLAMRILALAQTRKFFRSTGYLEKVTQALLSKNPKVAWPIFAKALKTTPKHKLWAICDFLSRSGGYFDGSGLPLWELSESMFRTWLKLNRKLIPLLLNKMSLCRPPESLDSSQPQDGPVPWDWHPHALILLEEGVEEKDITGALASNLLSFGSVGSRIPYLQERLKLVENLQKHQNKRLQRIGRQLTKIIESRIEWEKQEELRERAQSM